MPLNSEPIAAGVCPVGDRYSGTEVIDLDESCISVRYDEECGIEGPDIFMTCVPSLAGVPWFRVDG